MLVFLVCVVGMMWLDWFVLSYWDMDYVGGVVLVMVGLLVEELFSLLEDDYFLFWMVLYWCCE